MKIIAHRGVTSRAPENTMAAFLDAAKLGYGVECDVRLSQDGVPVIMHDPDLRRMTGSERALNQLTFAQLQSILIAGKHPIPTLEAVIKHVLPQTFVNFDIKEDAAVLPSLKLLAGALASHGMLLSGRTDHSAGLLMRNFSDSAFLHANAMVATLHARKVGAGTIVCRSWRINRPFIKSAIKSGLKVYVWGPSPSIDWAKSAGLAGVIKDI